MPQDFKSEIKLFLIVAAVSAVLAVAGILLLQVGLGPSSPTPVAQTPPPAAPSPQTPDTEDFTLSEVEGWQTYRNDEFGFELKYPPEFEIVFEGPAKQPGRHFLLGEFNALLQVQSGPEEVRTLTLAEAEMEAEFLKENYGQDYIFYQGENVNSRWTAFRQNTKNGILMYTFLEATSFAGQESIKTDGMLAAVVEKDGQGSFYLTFAGLDYLSFEGSDCTSIREADCPEPSDEDRKLFNQILSTFRFVEE